MKKRGNERWPVIILGVHESVFTLGIFGTTSGWQGSVALDVFTDKSCPSSIVSLATHTLPHKEK